MGAPQSKSEAVMLYVQFWGTGVMGEECEAAATELNMSFIWDVTDVLFFGFSCIHFTLSYTEKLHNLKRIGFNNYF